LIAEGGFYCDLDFVFLKNFEPLRHSEAIIGTQCRQKKKLCCAMMGCVPGNQFMKEYLLSYKDWTPKEQKKVWTYANIIPWKLSLEHPITVYPRAAFFPMAWSNKTFWTGTVPKLKDSYAIHLWETLHPELSMEVLSKTGLAKEIEKILNPEPVETAVSVRSGFLTFE
jgi:hypothetical protein